MRPGINHVGTRVTQFNGFFFSFLIFSINTLNVEYTKSSSLWNWFKYWDELIISVLCLKCHQKKQFSSREKVTFIIFKKYFVPKWETEFASPSVAINYKIGQFCVYSINPTQSRSGSTVINTHAPRLPTIWSAYLVEISELEILVARCAVSLADIRHVCMTWFTLRESERVAIYWLLRFDYAMFFWKSLSLE